MAITWPRQSQNSFEESGKAIDCLRCFRRYQLVRVLLSSSDPLQEGGVLGDQLVVLKEHLTNDERMQEIGM